MYPNLKAEMARKNVSQADLAKAIGVTQTTISLRTRGKRAFTLDSAIAIKEYLNTQLPLEVLFAKEEQ